MHLSPNTSLYEKHLLAIETANRISKIMVVSPPAGWLTNSAARGTSFRMDSNPIGQAMHRQRNL